MNNSKEESIVVERGNKSGLFVFIILSYSWKFQKIYFTTTFYEYHSKISIATRERETLYCFILSGYDDLNIQNLKSVLPLDFLVLPSSLPGIITAKPTLDNLWLQQV